VKILYCVPAVVAVVLASGCSTPMPSSTSTQMSTAFDAAEIAWSRDPGTASVEGSAAMTAPGGARHTCAGGEAQLVPAGAYAAEMMRIVFGNDVRGSVPLASARYPTNMVADFGKTVRRIGCDAEGRFRFDNVPPAAGTCSPTSSFPAAPVTRRRRARR
jgi:hypothetical protein